MASSTVPSSSTAPSTDPALRLLQAMGFSAVRVSAEVVALTTKAPCSNDVPLAKAA